MLLSVMREVRNFFNISSESGGFEIKNGSISVTNKYVIGQYVAITGSILNNGVKRVESFQDGVISFGINPTEYPAWIPYDGVKGIYATGDRVTHKGERWISLADNNVWEPGATGTAYLWEQIHDSPEEHTSANEAFTGTIYSLRVPPDFVVLCEEIQTFNDKPGANSEKISESFGSYSYGVATDANGNRAGWQMVFRNKLNPFRRMFTEVRI